MATLTNKRKLAAVTRETQEEHPRNGQSRNTSVPRINEEYITQFSEEIEGRVTKKLSQEFSRAESRILGALSKLDEFLLNPQITTHSETVPGTFRTLLKIQLFRCFTACGSLQRYYRPRIGFTEARNCLN